MDRGTSLRTIYLNDLPYHVTDVQYTELATLEGKVTFGDFTQDSDSIMSSKIWSSWAGGINVLNIREGADEGRYWFGDLDSVYPYQLGPRRKVHKIANVPYWLGDYKTKMYGVDKDKKLVTWDEPTKGVSSSLGTLTNDPVAPGIEFAGKLYIPQSLGFQSYDDTGPTLAAQNTTVKAVQFAIWNDRLWAITSDNKLYSSPDGSSWTLEYTMQSSENLRRITLWMDSSGEPTLFVATQTGIYGWDDLAQKLIPTRVRVPPHRDNGYGFAMWKEGEDLYFAKGMDIMRFTGNAISEIPVGLNRDEGLPVEYRGTIVQLEPGHNALYALVRGTAKSGLYQWNGYGWHPVHLMGSAAVPTMVRLSSATANSQDDLRLFWGFGTDGYVTTLSRQGLNLRQQTEIYEYNWDDFEDGGYIDLGWFDAGMPMFEKVASHLEINFAELATHSSTDVLVEYLTDNETSWATMAQGTAQNSSGPFTAILPFGVETTDDGNDFAAGMPFKRLRLKITLQRTDPQFGFALIQSIVLKYIKRPQQITNWTFPISIMTDTYIGDRSPEQIRDELKALSTSPGFVRLRLGEDAIKSYRVYPTRNQGWTNPGEDGRGETNFTVIHLPLDTWEGTTTHVTPA